MKMSETAINEITLEMRAACRRPIEEPALDTMFSWVRPEFERILDRLDGKKRWADLGPRVREAGRHLGAFADFFASHTGASVVGLDQLTQAMAMMRADCTVRAVIRAAQVMSATPTNVSTGPPRFKEWRKCGRWTCG